MATVSEHPHIAYVVTMNNLGASLILTEDTAAAIAHLAKTLRCSRHLVAQESETTRSEHPTPGSRLDHWMSSNSCNMDIFVVNGESPNEVVYSNPIIIQSNNNAGNGLAGENVLAIAAAIVFNLALAYQIHGMRNKNSPEHLRKAILLYEKALALPRSHHSTLFPMAVLNNLGTCHRALGRHNVAEKFFSALFTSLLVVQTANRDNLNSHFQLFSKNVWHLVAPNSPSTAPAA
jgi:tetratricopeptide (TPR) repeat protein